MYPIKQAHKNDVNKICGLVNKQLKQQHGKTASNAEIRKAYNRKKCSQVEEIHAVFAIAEYLSLIDTNADSPQNVKRTRTE